MTEATLKKPGERISVERRGRRGAHERSGVVAEVLGEPGHERYIVRWDDGDETAYYPVHPEDSSAPQEPPAAEPDQPVALEGPERPRLHASPGDRLIIHGHSLGEPERDAEILAVRGADGSPPFHVRWSDSGKESIFYPGSDARVEHIARGRGKRR